MQEYIWFLEANWDLLIGTILALILVGLPLAQFVVGLTPTKTDDTFVDRVAEVVNKLTKWFPNNLKDTPARESKKKIEEK